MSSFRGGILNLGGFLSFLVRFEARFDALLSSACEGSCYDVTPLFYRSGFYSFFISFFRNNMLIILLSAYLLFPHIFMFHYFFKEVSRKLFLTRNNT